MRRIIGFFAILVLVAAPPAPPAPVAAQVAQSANKRQTIQVEVRTQSWNGWGDGGDAVPDDLKAAQIPEKFERVETPAGAAPTFSGKVIGIPPDKVAQVSVVANRGTQWIQPMNYKAARVAADGAFTIVADHQPDAPKSLMVTVNGRLATFLRAEFEPTESAKEIELRLPEAKPVVVTMEDARGRAVPGFRYEIFTPFVLTDDAGKQLRIQRLAAGSAVKGAMVIESPLEPFAVLLSGNGVAPHYEMLDPRQADEFHFKMLPPSRIKGVVTRDGLPVAGEQIYLVNRAAPLSATLRKTDGQGRFDIGGRVPGQQDIRIAGYTTSVQLAPGETAEVDLEVGAAPPAPVPVPTVAR